MNLPELLQPVTSLWVLESLAHVLWQGTLLAAVTAVISAGLKSRSAQSRYVVHCIALGLTFSFLPWNLWRLQFTELKSASDEQHQAIVSADQPWPRVERVPKTAEAEASLAANGQRADAASPTASPALAESHIDWQRYANWLFVTYLAGMLAMSARLLAGLWGCQRLKLVSQPVLDSSVLVVIERATSELGLRVAPIVSYCVRVTTPVVVGVLKPAILLPPAMLTELTSAQIESLLLHELAHIRRYDHLVNLVQRIIEAVLFFHPAVWWLSHRISMEREHCCDDLAICWGSEPCEYAESLVRMSEIRLESSGLGVKSAAALAASGGRLTRLHTRVLRVLGMPLPGPTPGLTRRGLITMLVLGAATAAVISSRAEVAPERQAADADLAVAEARANTFGLQKVRRIAFSQGYRQAKIIENRELQSYNLENLWKIRDMQFTEDELNRNRHETLLAWDDDRLLLESFTEFQPNHTWRQTHYWDGQHGWIGENSVDELGETKNVYRYGSLSKLTEHIMPFYYPQWAAAGDRLPWPGPTVLIHEHQVDPALTHYQLVGVETIDDVLCDVYDGPERQEKIWIDLSTNLVKAVSRYYLFDFTPAENWQVLGKVAGRDFADQHDYLRWHEGLSAEQKTAIDALWSAETWKQARPGNLTVFSDYREIAPGAHWPHHVERIVVHPNGGDNSGYRFFYSQLEVRQVPDFDIKELADNALPDPGVKVTDRTGEMPFEYVWTNEMDQFEVERLRKEEQAKKRAEEEEIDRINATPIDSIDDAIHILTEGPKTDPSHVWARAVQYLTEHPDVAVPALIKTLDGENRDHPISKLAFSLRAIGDVRAVPALIRALPRTLLPSRSDYGLAIDDEELAQFMQQHDLGNRDGWTKIWGWTFDYGRAFREVVGALHKLTGQDFGEMQLNGIYLSGTESQRSQKRRLYHKFAKEWADWWEASWQTRIQDAAYQKVNLAPLEDEKAVVAGENLALLAGPGVEFIDDVSGAILQSVHESVQRCFVDLDTGRETGLPEELPPLGQTQLDSRELLAWARGEGFDIMGISYTPPGESEPLFCIKPLDLRAWQISEEEHRALPEMVLGKQPYPLSRPVELLVPRRTVPEPRDRKHSGDSFLFVTREGTSGVLRLTAQVTEVRDITRQIAYADGLFEPVGFYRGVRYELQTISSPTVGDAASNSEQPNPEPQNAAVSSMDEEETATSSLDGSWKSNQVLDFRVVNSQTGEPLSGVSLELQNAGPEIDFSDVKVQSTDHNGHSLIKLPDTPPTAVRVYPSKPGFVPLRVYWEGSPYPEMPESITIPMQPGTPFGGIIRNEQGEPISGVAVLIHYWGTGRGENPHIRANVSLNDFPSNYHAVTDEQGRWQVAVMPSQIDDKKLRIYLNHPDYVSDHLLRGFIPTPITKMPSTASLYAQTAVMAMRKGTTIAGRVTDEEGQPISNAMIYDCEYYWFAPGKPQAITDGGGDFQIAGIEFTDQTNRQWDRLYDIRDTKILTIESPGYAPELIEVRRDSAPLDIQLKPGNTAHGRVVDDQGNPIGGVTVWARGWRERNNRLHLEAKTNANGEFHLANVPSDAVTYDLSKEGYVMVERFSMLPATDEYLVTMKPVVRIVGSIVDADTGQSLEKCLLYLGIDYEDGRAPDWMAYDVKTIANGKYATTINQEGFAYRLRVEAAGYMPKESRVFKAYDPDRGIIDLDFRLSKASLLSGIVLGIDGVPMADADVYLAKGRMNILDRKILYVDQFDSQPAKTDATGRFEFPPEVEPFCLVVVHDEGIGMITEQQFKISQEIRIEPWNDKNHQQQIIRRPAPGQYVSFPEQKP